MPPDEPPERGEQLVERREPGRVGIVGRPRRPEVPIGVGAGAPPSARCVASSGSKNAIGSAMWMTTGSSRSAAVVQSGSSRGSSTATRRPAGSRARSPSSFQTLSPRAPRAAESRSRPPRSRRTPDRRPGVVVEPGEHRDAIGNGVLPSLDLGGQGVALAAVEVDDHLDAGRVEGRDQLGRRAVAHSPPNGDPRWLWASTTGNRGRRTSWAGTRRDERGRKSASRRSSAVIRAEDDDLAEVARRIRVAAAGQGELERERVARMEQQRQTGQRVQPAPDQARPPGGRAAGSSRRGRSATSCAPRRAASDDRDLLGRAGAADQPDDQHRPARTPRSGRGGTRAARRRSSGPGSSRSA